MRICEAKNRNESVVEGYVSLRELTVPTSHSVDSAFVTSSRE